MDRVTTALQRYKSQRIQAEQAPQMRKPAKEAFGVPVVYGRTRSFDIPRTLLREQRVMAGYEKGPFVDAYKILRTQVKHRLRENGWNVVGITSAGPGEGKTLTAVNLAVSLAMETTQTVLLVDSDLRNPAIHEVLGIKDAPGLADYLVNNRPIADLLVHPSIGRLVVLPGGRAISNSTEILSSPRMQALVEEFKHRYPSRVVIFDLPPLLHTADVLAFAPFIDALLLVVEEGKTTSDELQQALTMLKHSSPVLGTVLNKAGRSSATPNYVKKLLSK